MNSQILFGVLVAPAIIGLIRVAQEVGMPTKLSPILAVTLGVLAGLAQLEAGHWQWIQAVVIGISLGLSAVGLYAGSTSLLSALGLTLPSPAAPLPGATTTTTPTSISGLINGATDTTDALPRR